MRKRTLVYFLIVSIVWMVWAGLQMSIQIIQHDRENPNETLGYWQGERLALVSIAFTPLVITLAYYFITRHRQKSKVTDT